MTDTSLERFADKLLMTLYFTKGSRFAAHRRLLKKQHLSLFSISMLSIWVIAASIIPIFLAPISARSTNLLALITVIASIFIIVLSHVEAGQNYSSRAERMLRCAQKISELYYALEQRRLSNKLTDEFVDEIRRKYSEVLNDYSENHDDIDFLYYSRNYSAVNPPADFWSKLQRFLAGRYYTVLYYLNIGLFHLLLILIPPILIVLLLYGKLGDFR